MTAFLGGRLRDTGRSCSVPCFTLVCAAERAPFRAAPAERWAQDPRVRTAHLTGNAAPDGMSARTVPDAASAVQAPRRRGLGGEEGRRGMTWSVVSVEPPPPRHPARCNLPGYPHGIFFRLHPREHQKHLLGDQGSLLGCARCRQERAGRLLRRCLRHRRRQRCAIKVVRCCENPHRYCLLFARVSEWQGVAAWHLLQWCASSAGIKSAEGDAEHADSPCTISAVRILEQ